MKIYSLRDFIKLIAKFQEATKARSLHLIKWQQSTFNIRHIGDVFFHVVHQTANSVRQE